MLHADDVASVIIARSGSSLTSMQLQKLLYYVQSWHLAITDEPLFSEQIKAWVDGPVVPAVWHARKDPETRSPVNQHAEDIVLNDLASDLIELVLGAYGSMSGDELSALTHTEVPWREARGNLPAEANSQDPISRDTMARFYRSSRRLGKRTAADLAAGGIHVRARGTSNEDLDISAFLGSLDDEYADPGADNFGGANLAATISAQGQGS